MREQNPSNSNEFPSATHILKGRKKKCVVKVFPRANHTVASIDLQPVGSLGDVEWLGMVNGFTAGAMIPHLKSGRVFLLNVGTHDVVELVQTSDEHKVAYRVKSATKEDFKWMQAQ